jgi:hypothetical protein
LVAVHRHCEELQKAVDKVGNSAAAARKELRKYASAIYGLKSASPSTKMPYMAQLLEKRNCPNCGRLMVLALPPSGKGLRELQCMECDQPDPLDDDRAVGWTHGELRPPPNPKANLPISTAES